MATSKVRSTAADIGRRSALSLGLRSVHPSAWKGRSGKGAEYLVGSNPFRGCVPLPRATILGPPRLAGPRYASSLPRPRAVGSIEQDRAHGGFEDRGDEVPRM